MDEDKGSTDLLEPPELDDSSPSGGGASGMGQGLQSAAKSAKDVLGSAKGGGGDGIGSALKNGLGSIKGPGSSTSNPLSGMAGAGKSMDGMKGSMFKGLEKNSSPVGTNNTSGDKENPSAKDIAKKTGSNGAKQNSKVQDIANAIDTAKKEVKIGKAVAELGADPLADAQALKAAVELLKHPIKTIKDNANLVKYAALFLVIQVLMVFMIGGAIFFGIYKTYLVVQEAVTHPWRLSNVTTALRVNREMGSFLISAVRSLAYERDLAAQKQSGVAVAQASPNIPELESNPETSKMHEAWGNAGLAATFLDDYNASFEPSGGAASANNSDPESWDLIVNNQNFGPVTGTRAQAFIDIFAEETTHWKDIYTREALQGVASSEFNTQSFKLDLPDSERDIRNSRVNTTRQLVSSTAEPLTENAATYYKCLIAGGSNCNSLGLGSVNSGDNSPIDANGTPLEEALASLRNTVQEIYLNNTVGIDQIGEYAASNAEQVTPETSTHRTRDALSANIRTGASDTILSNLPKEEGDDTTPSSSVLLDLYDRYRAAVENENYARVNYDRASRQSIALSENYFIAGGQLLNNEMGLLDSWALSENLSTVTESSLFRSAVIGNPIGVFAQDSADDGVRSCQQIYNDLTPVGDVNQNVDRDTTNTSCFRRSLIPDRTTLLQDQSVNRIYGILDGKNKDVNQSGVFGKAVGDVLSQTKQKYQNQEIRSSPLATESIQVAQDLSPDFDGYTNNVYGTSETGAEVDGPAFDIITTAAEALWTQALIDDQVGIGASYQTDTQTSEVMRYANKIEREKMALKPLSQRLFAIKDSKSLVGKLAMMTPTTKDDGIKSTLALLRPSNLTSAVASRMVPSTFAQDTKPVNPLRAVRTGYALGDASNRMSGTELWDRYNCDAGGVTQETAKPEGVPFTLASNNNPCKREAVISQITTCWLDTEDSCSFGGTGSSSSTNGSSSGTVGDIGESSDDVPCAEGSNDIGDVESRYTGSLRKDNPLIIKLCQVPDVPGRGNDTSGNNKDGGIVVNSRVSGAWVALGRAAKNATPAIELSGSSFRLADSCGGGGDGSLCARPGTSMHQLGIAVDFTDMGSSGGSTSSCSGRKGAPGDPRWDWLFDNAQNFGIKQYSYEPWHWDTNQGANRCDNTSPVGF